MRRTLIALLLAVTVMLPLGAQIAPSVSASESGCSMAAYQPYATATRDIAAGSYTCSYDDPGNRQIQVCLKVTANGQNLECTVAYPPYSSYTLTLYAFRYCFPVYTWVWVYWENGTANTTTSGSVKPC